MNDEKPSPKDGDILGPDDARSDSPMGDNYIALISQYTERPDLLIGELELNRSGFAGGSNS